MIECTLKLRIVIERLYIQSHITQLIQVTEYRQRNMVVVITQCEIVPYRAEVNRINYIFVVNKRALW